VKFSLVNYAAISEEGLAPKITKDYSRKICEFTPRLSANPLKPSSIELFVYYGWDHFFRNTIIFFVYVSYSK
jgi:hypothetical protein